jgi:hypothetical protein
MRLSDALRTVATSMVDAAYNTAMRPVTERGRRFIAKGMKGFCPGFCPLQRAARSARGG